MSDKIRRMIELARGHVESGGIGAAGVYYRMILKDTMPPKNGLERVAHGEACIWYARKCLQDGKAGAATDWYRQAIIADPLAVDYRLEYVAKTLMPMGMLKNARIEAERATKLEPNNATAWKVLAGCEQALSNVEGAVVASEREIEITPEDPYARLDRCVIAIDIGDYATVETMCGPVLNDEKLRGEALNYLAMVAYRRGQHEKAIALYDEAIATGINDPHLATWNKSLAQHSIGDYANGWKNHEARGLQKTDEAMALLMRRFTVPIWSGQPAPARLHIHQEMGHGDIIAMARYIPLLVEQGYDVRLEVHDSMVDLMQRSFPEIHVMGKAIDYPGAMGVPMFDYHIPMLSLPAMFQTDIDTVPWRGAYLKANPDLVEHYRARLPNNGKRRIGLCWSSGIRTDGLWIKEYGRRKSMSFDTLRPLLDHSNDCLVSLQVGPERRERCEPVLDLLPEKPSWDDTAALVECLDLVVTVDTSVAHLAGAMGKPVIAMLQRDGASWHWMCARPGAPWNKRNPWYPSAVVVRQHQFNQPHFWNDVVADVLREIERSLDGKLGDAA